MGGNEPAENAREIRQLYKERAKLSNRIFVLQMKIGKLTKKVEALEQKTK